MTKLYVKDEAGKYRLVDRDQKQISRPANDGKVSLEEIFARVKRLESIVIDPRR